MWYISKIDVWLGAKTGSFKMVAKKPLTCMEINRGRIFTRLFVFFSSHREDKEREREGKKKVKERERERRKICMSANHLFFLPLLP